jgi:hypothetical protein
MKAIISWCGKHPFLTIGLIALLACAAWGPTAVGGWVGTHIRWCVLGAWRFSVALLDGAF